MRKTNLDKIKQGGKRVGSGRKKADYKTKTISFRVRVEFAEPTDQIIEAIIEFEPSQKRRVKNVRENVEICIKRLLRDQKIAQLTTDTYYLTIY